MCQSYCSMVWLTFTYQYTKLWYIVPATRPAEREDCRGPREDSWTTDWDGDCTHANCQRTTTTSEAGDNESSNSLSCTVPVEFIGNFTLLSPDTRRVGTRERESHALPFMGVKGYHYVCGWYVQYSMNTLKEFLLHFLKRRTGQRDHPTRNR